MAESLWSRRPTGSTSKLSLSTTTNDDSTTHDGPHSARPYIGRSRTERQTSIGGEGGPRSSHGRFTRDPFSTMTVDTRGVVPSLASPTSAKPHSAFGLGSGAFASFGPKTPSTSKSSSDLNAAPASSNGGYPSSTPVPGANGSTATTFAAAAVGKNASSSELAAHPTRFTWVVWYRAPGTKFQDYEKSTQKIAAFSSVEEFWTIYAHLKRPSGLPHVSDYHVFRKGVRPVWEDEENRKGGKWIVRLKKGVSSRYWEELLMAIVSDQFGESGEDLCGAVLSIRGQEDVLSVWTRIETGANLKIRDTIKRVLNFPPETNMVFKSHDESIAHEKNVHQAQQQKPNNRTEGKVDKERSIS